MELKEDIFNLETDFSKECTVQINWSHSLQEAPNLFDCSFDDAMHGFDLYAIELKNETMPNDSSLLFYNSKNRNENGKITNKNGSIICYQGVDLNEGGIDKNESNEKYDGIFLVNFDSIGTSADRLMFFIGRPKTNSENCKHWIDSTRVKKVLNEKVDVEIFINDKLVKTNCQFHYNKWGALKILELYNDSKSWKIMTDNQIFQNGLQEIIELYEK
jgi:hypothetical protein